MHIPVFKKEILKYLNPKPNENFIDCTIGEGGHSAAILEKIAPRGKILGIDQDPEILEAAKIKNQIGPYGESTTAKIKNRLILVNDSYINIKEIVKKKRLGKFHGILFDLGMSSWHLEKSGRGFSFLRNEPLDMRYQTRLKIKKDPTGSLRQQKSKIQFEDQRPKTLTAERIVNEWTKKEIEKILREYSQERFAKKISKEIIIQRKIKPIKSTFQLNEIIKKAVPLNYERGRIHPATRTFQSLRITVNKELDNLKIVLPQALEVLAPSGKLAIISFHSLEDKIVKKFLKEKSKQGLIKILTKKPVKPTAKEIIINPRSRSAKLRVAVKM